MSSPEDDELLRQSMESPLKSATAPSAGQQPQRGKKDALPSDSAMEPSDVRSEPVGAQKEPWVPLVVKEPVPPPPIMAKEPSDGRKAELGRGRAIETAGIMSGEGTGAAAAPIIGDGTVGRTMDGGGARAAATAATGARAPVAGGRAMGARNGEGTGAAIDATSGDGTVRRTTGGGGGGPGAPVDGGRATGIMGVMSGEGTVARTMGARAVTPVVGGRVSGTSAASPKIGDGTVGRAMGGGGAVGRVATGARAFTAGAAAPATAAADGVGAAIVAVAGGCDVGT